MSDKVVKGGFRQKKGPTKKEVVNTYQKQLSQLASSMSQQYSTCIQKIMQLERVFQLLDNRVDVCDYRSLSTLKLLENKELFGEGEHTAMAESLKLQEFVEASAKDDERRKLQVVENRGAEMGDIITISLEAFNTENNEKIDALSAMRSKIDLGRGQMSIIEKELTGLVVGEKKEFTLKLGKEFGEFADKDVKFVVETFDLKQLPPKEETGDAKEAKAKEETV